MVQPTRTVVQGIVAIVTIAGIVLSAAPLMAQEPGAAAGSTWLQWRGAARDGTVAGPTWPDALESSRLEKLWHADLGPGYSGPLVTEKVVYVTETRDAKTEHVRALDRATGKELWQAGWEGAMTVPFFAASNGSWIRATPAIDGGRIYVAGMCDLLVCLDAETGAEVWRVDFVKDLKSDLPAFGFVSSPLVLDDAVFVQAGGGFCKLDKATGKLLWRVLDDGGGMNGSGTWIGGKVTMTGITDGTSNTLVVSEKQLNPTLYENGSTASSGHATESSCLSVVSSLFQVSGNQISYL